MSAFLALTPHCWSHDLKYPFKASWGWGWGGYLMLSVSSPSNIRQVQQSKMGTSIKKDSLTSIQSSLFLGQRELLFGSTQLLSKCRKTNRTELLTYLQHPEESQIWRHSFVSTNASYSDEENFYKLISAD